MSHFSIFRNVRYTFRLCVGLIALFSASTATHAGSEQKQVINIEAAMRAWQERNLMRSPFKIWWPASRTSLKDPGPFPADGFYNEELVNPEYAADLVETLYYELMGSNYTYLAVAPAEHLDLEDYLTVPDISDINTTNYETVFRQLVEYINSVKTSKISVNIVNGPRLYGRGENYYYGTKAEAVAAAVANLHVVGPPSSSDPATRLIESFRYGTSEIYFRQNLVFEEDVGIWYARIWEHPGSIKIFSERAKGTIYVYRKVTDSRQTISQEIDEYPTPSSQVRYGTSEIIEPFLPYTTVQAGGIYSDTVYIDIPETESRSFPYTVVPWTEDEDDHTSVDRRRIWTFQAFLQADYSQFVGEPLRTITVGCPTCPSNSNGCPLGALSAENACVDVAIDLGHTGTRSAGTLTIRSELPHDDLASPVALRLKNESGLTLVRAADSSERVYFRQIITPQGLLDVIIDDAHSYHIDFYSANQIGTADPVTKVRAVTGTPYQRIDVENPEAMTPLTSLQVTRSVSGVEKDRKSFVWDTALAAWELTEAAGTTERTTKRIPQASPGLGLRREIVEVRDESDNLLSKRQLTFREYPWNLGPDASNTEELVEEVNDPDGTALTTSYEYYETTDVTTGALYGRLKSTSFPDGSWEKTQYYDAGKTSYVTSPWQNTALNQTGPVKYVHRKVSPTNPDLYSIEEGIDDAGVKQRMKLRFELNDYDQTLIYRSRSGQTFHSDAPNFDASSGDNLVFITSYYNSGYLDGSFSGRVFREVNPDGTGKVYGYRNLPEGFETTVYDGLLTAEYAAEAMPAWPANGLFALDSSVMTKGTKTIILTNSAREEIERSVYDLESGELVSFSQATLVDDFGRATQRDYHDGTYEEFHYDCCGLEYSIDREGIRTDYEYGAFGVLEKTTRAGLATKTTEEFVDGAVNTVTTRIGSDETEMEMSREVRDLAGRTLSTLDYGLRTTSYDTVYSSNGETVRTTTYPGGGTRVETYYRSGKLKSATGTAVSPISYEYGIEAPFYWAIPRYFVKTIRVGSANEQTEWRKTYYDGYGRAVYTLNPDFYSDGVTNTYIDYSYKADTVESKTILTSDEDGYARISEYDDLGRPYLEVQDIDWDWETQIDGLDRVKRTTYSVTTRSGGAKVRRALTEIWTEDNSADAGKTVTVDVSLDGLIKWQSIKDLATEKELTTLSVTSYDRATATRTETTTYPDQTSLVSTYINGRLQSNVRRNSSNATVAQVSYEYDEHGRLEDIIDSAYGTTSYTYHGDDQIKTTVTPDPDTSKAGAGYDAQTTEIVYDDAGRVWKTILPDTRIEVRKYYPTGKLKLLYGGDNYPRQYFYDSQGRMKTLTTWKSFNATTETGSGEAVTTWNYHPQRGWLESKVLPATTVYDELGVASVVNPTVSYIYSISGRVEEKTNARGITTTYGYNDAGELWTLTYSDNTPGVTFTYNREGQMHTVTDAAGVLTRTYNLIGAIDDETYSGTGALAGQAIARTFDDQDRLDTLSFGGGAYSVDWGYDSAGRVDTINQGGYTAQYSYRPNSVVTEGVTYKQGTTVRGSIERKQDAMGRVWRADTYAGTTLVARRDYTFDQNNRRTEAVREDGRKWVYGYNGKSEVESAQLNQGAGDPSPNAPLPGFSFGYGFDDIGNRTIATTNGRVETYTADTLNRLTERRGPVAQGNFVDVRGAADADVMVLVNDIVATRTDEDFYVAAPVKAARAELKVQAVQTTPSISVATETVGARVAESNYTFLHDLDGNLQNHIWAYEWDAENRLKAAETESSGAATVAGLPARQRIEYKYDAFSRCIERTVNQRNATNTGWEVTQTTRYLYDGWNRVAELDGSSNAVARTYVWGLDVSGTSQGAGGVGGLLWANLATTTHAPGYDGNGNITIWVGLGDGAVTGAIEFGPFGEPLARSGIAREIPYGFSTKPVDSYSGLVYYGYRWYDSCLGRWLSLDPAEEAGGVNLYAMVGNGVVNQWDYLGLVSSIEWKVSRWALKNTFNPAYAGVYGDDIKRYQSGQTIYVEYAEFSDDNNDIEKLSGAAIKDVLVRYIKSQRSEHEIGYLYESLTLINADLQKGNELYAGPVIGGARGLNASGEIRVKKKCTAGLGREVFHFYVVNLDWTWYDKFEFKTFEQMKDKTESTAGRILEGSLNKLAQNQALDMVYIVKWRQSLYRDGKNPEQFLW